MRGDGDVVVAGGFIEAEGFCAAVGCGHLGAEVCGGQEPDEGFGLGHVLQA
jgi:hypothetical protein